MNDRRNLPTVGAMRPLRQIISENARLALERANRAAQENGEGRVTQAEVARRMSKRMVRREGPGREKRGEKFDPKSLYRSLTDLLAGRKPWRDDYLEAFAASVGANPARLASDNYDAAKLPDAHHVDFLARALGRRLEAKEARRIIRNLNRELDRTGMYELVSDIAEAILAAESAREADAAASKLIFKSADLFEKRPRSRGSMRI